MIGLLLWFRREIITRSNLKNSLVLIITVSVKAIARFRVKVFSIRGLINFWNPTYMPIIIISTKKPIIRVSITSSVRLLPNGCTAINFFSFKEITTHIITLLLFFLQMDHNHQLRAFLLH